MFSMVCLSSTTSHFKDHFIYLLVRISFLSVLHPESISACLEKPFAQLVHNSSFLLPLLSSTVPVFLFIWFLFCFSTLLLSSLSSSGSGCTIRINQSLISLLILFLLTSCYRLFYHYPSTQAFKLPSELNCSLFSHHDRDMLS